MNHNLTDFDRGLQGYLVDFFHAVKQHGFRHGGGGFYGDNRMGAMTLSGLLGGALLCGADLLARSAGGGELPVSMFTSLLGAPLLVYLAVRGRDEV